MNFLDTYDATAPVNPTPGQPEQSLNEEVSQVFGQLGRFWGGFKQQSQSALQAARRDLGDVVVQAQKELSKLTTVEASEAPREADGESSRTVNDDTEPTASTSNSSIPSTSTSSQTLFSRIQAALPPNIVATVQNNLPESLKHASENIDLAQLRTNLLTEIQRVQGVTLAQAEEYAHKSESLLREAMKEAGEVLRDAVKVIPPEEETAHNATSTTAVWDGSDMWMLPFEPTESTVAAEKKSSDTTRDAGENYRAVATRAEALLKRLKHDPSIIRHDPESEPSLKEQYTKWLETNVDVNEGGITGEVWTTKINEALEDPVDGNALRTIQVQLAPSEMTTSIFWARYFFRSFQIRQEEEKRQALIKGSTENEEDFSWEDEDDEGVSPPATAANSSTLPDQIPKESKSSDKLAVPPSKPFGSSSSSPRNSSDSFDVVSSNVSVADDAKAKESKKDSEDDADSDWE